MNSVLQGTVQSEELLWVGDVALQSVFSWSLPASNVDKCLFFLSPIFSGRWTEEKLDLIPENLQLLSPDRQVSKCDLLAAKGWQKCPSKNELSEPYRSGCVVNGGLITQTFVENKR